MNTWAMDWQELEASIQRRRHARREVRLPAQLTWHGQQFHAQTENISPGGAQLSILLPAGATEVVARIGLRTGRAVRVRAKVVWQRQSPPAVGIQFSSFLAPFEPD